MAEVQVGLGVRIAVPEGVSVSQMAEGTDVGLAAATVVGPPASPLEESLLAAGFHIVADVKLSRVAPPPSGLGAAVAAVPSVSVDVQGQQGALLLIETSDGVFAWHYPQARLVQPAGLGMAAPGVATLTFSLAAPPRPAVLALSLGDVVSPVLHWVLGKALGDIRARVLKFVAGAAVDFAIDKVEGADVTGLTTLAPDTPALWRPGGAPILPLDMAKPAKVLLMVHGTFSNTTGSFGQLTTTQDGASFLKAARSHYNAVWGFDHKTLAVGPDVNASDMLAALKPLLPQGSTVDAVAYSRGGLVYREFAERLAPQARPDLRFGKAVLVGCTNGGTHLAEPKNWKALIDIYTNIAMASTRGITAAVGAPLAGVIAGETIQILGLFVQYLSVVAISDQRVPGLAGMEPDPPGAIVHALNTATTGLDKLADYYAITSNFVAQLSIAKGITQDLKEMIVDEVTDGLFTDDNDLVVDTGFMTTLGSRDRRLTTADTFAFGSEDLVYHLNYFGAAQTAQRLSAWLL